VGSAGSRLKTTTRKQLSPTMSGSTLTAARGTLLSIALRLFSFLLSQLTVRFVSAAALGKASIPLELLLSTALFVGREGFRLALTKEIGGDGDDAKQHGDVDRDDDARRTAGWNNKQRSQQIINVSWLSVPVGAILSLLALSMHLHRCNKDDYDSDQDPYALLDYKLAGILYCIASFVESLSEPLVIRCLQQMDVTTKAKAEGVALVTKSLTCFGCLYFNRYDWYVKIIIMIMRGHSEANGASSTANFAVTSFGISQLVYASVFTSMMFRKARSSTGGILWPKNIKASMSNHYRGTDAHHTSQYPTRPQNFHSHTLYLVFVFTLQGLFKHALTEADKFVLSGCAGSYDQGVYALAASYGGKHLVEPMQ
jgi:oligosaccharide translocation protein RFT1